MMPDKDLYTICTASQDRHAQMIDTYNIEKQTDADRLLRTLRHNRLAYVQCRSSDVSIIQ